jgi:hypothetical protein
MANNVPPSAEDQEQPMSTPEWIGDLEAEQETAGAATPRPNTAPAVSRRQGRRPPLPRPADVEGWWDDYVEMAESQGRRALTDELDAFLRGTEVLAETAESLGLDSSPLVEFLQAARRFYHAAGGCFPPPGGGVQVLLDRLKYRLEHQTGHAAPTPVPQQPPAVRGKRRRTPRPKPAPAPAVVLHGQGKCPVVLGKSKPVLTFAQDNVVTALLQAGEGGLSKDELARNSGHTDALGILRRLAGKDPDWAAVIRFAGQTGGRYRIILYPD